MARKPLSRNKPAENPKPDYITITLPKSSRDRVLGKLIVVCILSCLIGFFFARDKQANHARAQGLSLEAYIELYESHIAAETRGPTSYSVGVLIFLVAFLGLFSFYELVGLAADNMVGKILVSDAEKPDHVDDTRDTEQT